MSASRQKDRLGAFHSRADDTQDKGSPRQIAVLALWDQGPVDGICARFAVCTRSSQDRDDDEGNGEENVEDDLDPAEDGAATSFEKTRD